MRILHLGKYYPPHPGGMEVFLRDLAEEQVRQGHEVCVLAHGSRRFLRTDALHKGVRVVRAGCLGELTHAPVSPAFPVLLQRLLATWKPDIIHAHLPNCSAFWALAVAGMRIPLVAHWHADVDAATGDARLQRLYPLYNRFENMLLRRAAAIVATSQHLLKASRALAPYRDLCRVVPLGRRDPLPPGAKPPSPSAEPLIYSVGRFARYKRFHVLVQAMRQLPQARCVIAGEGPELQRVRREVNRLGLQDRVSLPGWLDDQALAKLYSRCRIFCLPSQERTEAFGLALLEAMAWQRPLVTPPVPGSGVLWLNRHEITGLHAAGPEPQDLAAVLQRLLHDPALCQTLGRNGRQFFTQNCVIDKVARQIEGVYCEVCAAQAAIVAVKEPAWARTP